MCKHTNILELNHKIKRVQTRVHSDIKSQEMYTCRHTQVAYSEGMYRLLEILITIWIMHIDIINYRPSQLKPHLKYSGINHMLKHVFTRAHSGINHRIKHALSGIKSQDQTRANTRDMHKDTLT